ncbi:hypothetical protein [Streptomyces lavendulocolor]|uniref:hypothetical protein n=1 Tax=Streptomyces lavendulocolor TaxID=67316 RepID=UPI003C2C026B
MRTHAPEQDVEMVAALEDAEQALRMADPGADADAAVARLAAVAGPALRRSTRHALRTSIGSGRLGPLWDDAFRVARTSRQPWVVAVPDRARSPLPRLLWTEPWPEGERHVIWAHSQVSAATRRLYRYAGDAPAPVRLVARRLRHPRRAGLLHPLGRLSMSPCGSAAGCLCCPATELLVAEPGEDGADAPGCGGAWARWVALACFLGREGPLRRSGTASRSGSPEDRAAASVMTGLTASWLYLSTAAPPAPAPALYTSAPGPAPGRAAQEAVTLAVWRSYAGTDLSRAAPEQLREGARRLLREAVAALKSPYGAADFAAWPHRAPQAHGRGRQGAATTNEEE